MARRGRPLLGDVKMTASTLVRMTPEQLDELKAAAAADGLPLGRWLREMGLRRAARLKRGRSEDK